MKYGQLLKAIKRLEAELGYSHIDIALSRKHSGWTYDDVKDYYSELLECYRPHNRGAEMPLI